MTKHRRNQSCNAIDLHQYKLYTGKSFAGTDAATQTDEKRRRRKTVIENEIEEEELNRDEISPPPSDSSPESDEKQIGRLERDDEKVKSDLTGENKVKASTVLRQLISCGSFRNCGPGNNNTGFSLVSHYKSRMLPRGGEDGVVLRKNRRSEKVVCEDKEYFSGSLLQTKTKKEEFLGLKRSNSYTVNR